MSSDLIKANLNLYAVLQNLEDIVRYDPEINSLAKNWDVVIQFSVRGGPKAHIAFKDEVCRVVRGTYRGPDIKLFFTSPAHCNRMFDNKGNPIPLKGFTKIGFLTKEFPKLTERLEYYLKPTDDLLKNKDYLEMNTRLTLNTALYAARELALLDPVGIARAAHIGTGVVQLRIRNGPSAYINFKNGEIEVEKGDWEKPMALMEVKNLRIANDLFNGRVDSFAAVAAGDIVVKGKIMMVESLSVLFDRIPIYLS